MPLIEGYISELTDDLAEQDIISEINKELQARKKPVG